MCPKLANGLGQKKKKEKKRRKNRKKKRTDYTPNISYLDLVYLDSPCHSTAGVYTFHGSSVRYVTENPEVSDADYDYLVSAKRDHGARQLPFSLL